MSYHSGIAALAIAALALSPSVARAQAAPTAKTTQKVADSTLDNRVEARLKADATLKNLSIDVAVDNGVVTLTGTVHSAIQRSRAETLARIRGVARVENKLDVTAATTGAAEKDKKTMEKAGEKTGKTMDKAAAKAEKTMDKAVDKTKSGASEVGEVVTDAWITTALHTKFVDEDTLKGSDINVDTNNHVVTLKGTVATAAGRARAVEIAKTTKGVSRVIDTLTIGPKK